MEKLINVREIEQTKGDKNYIFAVLDSSETVAVNNCNADCRIETLWEAFSNKGYIVVNNGNTERVIRFENIKEIYKTKLAN